MTMFISKYFVINGWSGGILTLSECNMDCEGLTKFIRKDLMRIVKILKCLIPQQTCDSC